MKKLFLISTLLATILVSCTQSEDIKPLKASSDIEKLDAELIALLEQNANGNNLKHFMLPQSDDFKSIPQDPKNPITSAKVELGKLLFHDPGLAVVPKLNIFRDTYSCASCHHHLAGFHAGRPQGIGEGGTGFGRIGEARTKDNMSPEDSIDVQSIRAPTILNSAYQEVMLWNGQFGATGPNIGTENSWTSGTLLETNFLGFHGIETQAIAGMTTHRQDVPIDLIGETEYKQMIDAAFPEIPSQERYTKITLGLAMAAYQRTTLSNKAPFQQYLKGNWSALTENQKQGAILFFGKANCVACHNGPALNSMEFYAIGMKDLEGDGVFGNNLGMVTRKGRGGFTGEEEDNFKFKTPQLYNLKMANFLGHGSSFTNVYEVIKYKNTGVKENEFVPDTQLAKEFKPLGLTETEMKFLTTFIEYGLFDPNLARYEPDYVPSGLCFPNNDEASRIDLGCILP